ncbi:MAG TPA: radical SAM protein [Thermodesulfovibrionales bacterium]|nr:radical SAM protein [Thermodesulfovibrionales bacterium]
MKKILFITLYDMICYGMRILSSLAKQSGLESHMVLFKSEKSYMPIWTNKDRYDTYQYYYNGLLRGSFYAIDPYTDKDIEILIDTIRDVSPGVICLSTRSFAYPFCKEIFGKIRKEFPHIPVVGGGWGPSLEPEKFLEFCDYVCFGEGESAIRGICDALVRGSNFDHVPNLIYRRGSLIRNEVSPPFTGKELEALPYPDFSTDNKYLIDGEKMSHGSEFYNKKVYDCFAGRGCPMNCTYCMSSKYREIYKEYTNQQCSKYRLRSLDTVLNEVRLAKERGAEFIRFKDEVFPIDPRWVKGFLERYEAEIGLPFFGFVRPEFHSVDTIRALRDAGLNVTMVGIQSGAEDILKNVYRRMLPKEKIIKFSKTLSDLNIQFSYHFIYRNPFETEDNLRESLEFTYSLPFANAFIYKLQLFPGSPLSRMAEEAKPFPLPRYVANWYAMLHSLSLKGPRLRKVARYVHKYRLFRRKPVVLSLVFLGSLIKEYVDVLKNRYVYKAALHFSPKTK